MKALVVKAPGIIEYQEVQKPVPGPHEVVSRVCYCGICGTDGEIYHGDTSLAENHLIHYPVRIGHEWSGVVESVGSEVHDFKPGDRVISDTGSSCGKCEACLSGNFRKCENLVSLGTIGDFKEGAFAEYIVMHEWHMHKVPDEISLEEAALVEPGTVALHALENSRVQSGETILVTGTGVIGLMAVNLAKQMGLRVLLAGRKPFKLNIGRQMGADITINTMQEDLSQAVLRATDGRGVDVFFDTTGAMSIVNRAMDLTAYAGRIALLAFYDDLLNAFDVNRLVMYHKSLLGCEGTDWCAPRVLDIVKQKKVPLTPMITHRVAFEEAAEAIRNSRRNTAEKIKVMVQTGKE